MTPFVCQMLNIRNCDRIREITIGYKSLLIAMTLCASVFVQSPQTHAIGIENSELLSLQSGTFEPSIVDPYTGIAGGGFDPVAYFIDGKSIPGSQDLQATLGESTYYFRTVANRDAFLQSPQIYRARFGAHCAMQMARGLKVAGNPTIWAIFRGRLFYFHSKELRDEWLAKPGGYAVTAEAEWKKAL